MLFLLLNVIYLILASYNLTDDFDICIVLIMVYVYVLCVREKRGERRQRGLHRERQTERDEIL